MVLSSRGIPQTSTLDIVMMYEIYNCPNHIFESDLIRLGYMCFKMLHNVKFQHNKEDFLFALGRYAPSHDNEFSFSSSVQRFTRSYGNNKFVLGCDVHFVYESTKECEVSNYKEQYFLAE